MYETKLQSGRPPRPKKGDDKDSNNSDEDSDESQPDEDTPALNSERDSNANPSANPSANKSKFNTNGKSNLWNADTTAADATLAARFAAIRPLVPPINRKTYTNQQQLMRFLAMLAFAHTCVAFQILCVFDLQCFDVMDNPGECVGRGGGEKERRREPQLRATRAAAVSSTTSSVPRNGVNACVERPVAPERAPCRRRSEHLASLLVHALLACSTLLACSHLACSHPFVPLSRSLFYQPSCICGTDTWCPSCS